MRRRREKGAVGTLYIGMLSAGLLLLVDQPIADIATPLIQTGGFGVLVYWLIVKHEPARNKEFREEREQLRIALMSELERERTAHAVTIDKITASMARIEEDHRAEIETLKSFVETMRRGPGSTPP